MKLVFFVKINLLIASSFLLLACQLAVKTEPQPARLVSSNDRSIANPQIDQAILNEVKMLVQQSLNGAKVKLAKHFLIHSSWLIIEPSHKKTISNPQPLGRSYQTPIKFQLLKSDEQCFIKQSGTKKLWPLKKAKCRLVE